MIDSIDLPTVQPDSLIGFGIVAPQTNTINLGGDSYPTTYSEDGEIEGRDIKYKMYWMNDTSMDVAPIKANQSTPVQYVNSERIYLDIPNRGEAYYLTCSPEGQIYFGSYSDWIRKPNFVISSKGWTINWIVPQGSKFEFTEVCEPAFMTDTEEMPGMGKDIIELPDPRVTLPETFWELKDVLQKLPYVIPAIDSSFLLGAVDYFNISISANLKDRLMQNVRDEVINNSAIKKLKPAATDLFAIERIKVSVSIIKLNLARMEDEKNTRES